MAYVMTQTLMEAYRARLQEEERAKLTIRKYMRDLERFFLFLPKEREVTKGQTLAYKEMLGQKYKVSSANSMIAALNGFLKFCGWTECRVRQFKVQRTFFRQPRLNLNRTEYERLVRYAQRDGDFQTSCLVQTICSTGIRVSELEFITVEAVRAGQAQIFGKGKMRMVFLTRQLRRQLQNYCRQRRIVSGAIFLSSQGKPLDRSVVWRRMKRLAKRAGVAAKKVFPHNLRHLFAVTFYEQKKDLLRLAEVLGHASIETTRIYTAAPPSEHRRMLEKLGLVIP